MQSLEKIEVTLPRVGVRTAITMHYLVSFNFWADIELGQTAIEPLHLFVDRAISAKGDVEKDGER